MERLDEEVEACCNECDDAADAAELEAQLSQFEQVGGGLEQGRRLLWCVRCCRGGCHVPREDVRAPQLWQWSAGADTLFAVGYISVY
jgi:hypothetical protein